MDEIQYRLAKAIGRQDYEDHFDIGTIHSFCLNNVFRPFHAHLKPFAGGYEVLPPEHEEYQEGVRDIMKRHRLDNQAFDDFGLLQRGEKLPYRITQAAAYDFWYFLDSNAYVDFNGIISYSSQICRELFFVSSALASKYAWILVDEFQDTFRLSDRNTP